METPLFATSPQVTIRVNDPTLQAKIDYHRSLRICPGPTESLLTVLDRCHNFKHLPFASNPRAAALYFDPEIDDSDWDDPSFVHEDDRPLTPQEVVEQRNRFIGYLHDIDDILKDVLKVLPTEREAEDYFYPGSNNYGAFPSLKAAAVLNAVDLKRPMRCR